LREETSDLVTTYSAMENFQLPHSGLTVGFRKALIIRPSGDLSDRGVVPNVKFEAPLFSANDGFLEKTLTHVREHLGR